MRQNIYRSTRPFVTIVVAGLLTFLAGCSSWEGPNSLPLPGAQGHDDKSYTVQIELPNVLGIQRNSRILLNEVNVGSITDVTVSSWHAIVTATIEGGTVIPGNAIARVGQTSLLGTLHIEFDIPEGEQAEGALAPGARVPLDRAGAYPSTEETLAAVSVVLNGGGLSELAEVQQEITLALQGSEPVNRQMIENLARFTTSIAGQTDTIVEAIDGVNRLAGQLAEEKPVLDRALRDIPAAIDVVGRRQQQVVDAINAIGGMADNTNQIVTRAGDDLDADLESLAPALRALANSGRDLTRSLGLLSTYPWPETGVQRFIRGDYANLSAVIDLTLGRLDSSFLTGTPYEGSWAALEVAMGRKTGIMPRPGDGNPLAIPTSGGR
jgi:phospholipid/cholesterol/gamma-HCH transport system substrate-binding protein